MKQLTSILLCVFFLSCNFNSNFAPGTSSLPRTSPEKVQVNTEGINDFLSAIEDSGQEFHSMMILHKRKVIAEKWWNGHTPDSLHKMFSVSKSFTAAAVGFAIAENYLTVNDKVISFFPEDLPDTISPYLAQLRVHDLLTMSTGQEREPDRSYRNENDNWEKLFFNTPIIYQPGTRFHYNSMASYMLSAIVQKVSGEKIFDYLTPRLFEPLDIHNISWEENSQGVNVGGWGMNLKTEDMAKFGQLFLQNGSWNGTQLLPEGWAEEASAYQIANSDENPEQIGANPTDWNQGYAYQMWRTKHNGYRADGANGQEIIIIPDADLVVIFTANLRDLGEAFNIVWEKLLPIIPKKNNNQ